MNGDYEVFPVSITPPAALSDPVDLRLQRLHRIDMPAGWTAAPLTFQVSDDGVDYADLYTDQGEYQVAAGVAGASRAIVVDQVIFFAVRWLRVRSGTSGAPVLQAVQRDLQLVTAPR